MNKTNVMRILDQQKIKYSHYEYDKTLTNGVEVANYIKRPLSQVFKTLVTCGSDLNHYVFVIPVQQTLDLKKAAASVGVKNIEMLKQKDLFNLTGYVHGGCSPIGMKKLFKTVVDNSATKFETIIFSAGKIGFQVEMSPIELQKLISCDFKGLTMN